MKILLSNDDGVNAKGIEVLYQALSQIAEVVVVAPDRNCSGASNSLTLLNPLRAHTHDNGFISINGTPSDCVQLALNKLLDFKPDLVVAGINNGANLGDDTLYSGTVAAASEGRFLGLPAIAVSLCSKQEAHYETAAAVAVSLIKKLTHIRLSQIRLLTSTCQIFRLVSLKALKLLALAHVIRPIQWKNNLTPGAGKSIGMVIWEKLMMQVRALILMQLISILPQSRH
jgi:5'-nucleotidase